ncbi:unnamed protein product [Dicrocoelium dendriticum]|nr:unnamed protein product [Dicrocoelium dendriticum]
MNALDSSDEHIQRPRTPCFDEFPTESTTALQTSKVHDTCATCGQRYPANVMQQHTSNCKGSHVCSYCGSTFSRSSYLRRHVNRMHSSFGRPICSVCLKTFSSTSALSLHQRLHRDDAPYRCEFCGARFSQGCHLEFHLDSYHAHLELKNMQKPLTCDFCDRKFLFSISLRNHRKQHLKPKPKELTCPKCGHSFAFRSELERHYITHLKRPVFNCSLCSKSFSRLSRLNAHMRRHLAPDLLSCRYCFRTYASQAYLTQHLKKHCVSAAKLEDLTPSNLFGLDPETIFDKFDVETGQDNILDEISYVFLLLRICCISAFTSLSKSTCLSGFLQLIHAFLIIQKFVILCWHFSSSSGRVTSVHLRHLKDGFCLRAVQLDESVHLLMITYRFASIRLACDILNAFCGYPCVSRHPPIGSFHHGIDCFLKWFLLPVSGVLHSYVNDALVSNLVSFLLVLVAIFGHFSPFSPGFDFLGDQSSSEVPATAQLLHMQPTVSHSCS